MEIWFPSASERTRQMLHLNLLLTQKTSEVCLDEEYLSECAEQGNMTPPQGPWESSKLYQEGQDSHVYRQKKIWQCCQVSMIHRQWISTHKSKSDTTKGVLWAQFLIGCTTFSLTYEKSRGTSYKQTWDLRFLYIHAQIHMCLSLCVYMYF